MVIFWVLSSRLPLVLLGLHPDIVITMKAGIIEYKNRKNLVFMNTSFSKISFGYYQL